MLKEVKVYKLAWGRVSVRKSMPVYVGIIPCSVFHPVCPFHLTRATRPTCQISPPRPPLPIPSPTNPASHPSAPPPPQLARHVLNRLPPTPNPSTYSRLLISHFPCPPEPKLAPYIRSRRSAQVDAPWRPVEVLPGRPTRLRPRRPSYLHLSYRAGRPARCAGWPLRAYTVHTIYLFI